MTIAYSNRYNAWSTRYSFEPTCYASTDNFFISSKDGEGVWEHDVNDVRCKFYNEDPSGASIEVASNQDPSAVKIFKAISIETNENEWTAEVFTNDEYTGNERQEGSIDSFISKEGYKYADTPRSSINSSSNIVPCPSPLLDISGSFTNIEGGVSATFFLPYTSSISLPLSSKTRVKYLDQSTGPSVLSDPLGVEVYAVSISGTEVTFEFIGFEDTDLMNNATLIATDFPGMTLFLVSPASVNGDSMRGPYLRTKITTTTTEPLELHAINVDYEFSKLDARLTQNT